MPLMICCTAASASFSDSISYITYLFSELRIHFKLIHGTSRIHSFKCTFISVRSPRFGTFGHWLSEVNALEIKKLTTI